MVQLRQGAKLQIHVGCVDMKDWKSPMQHRHRSRRNVVRS
jgi:hypothetical protein